MKIIIVEDKETLRQELCLFLSKYGYETVALSRYDNVVQDILHESPHLVLLDINLPVFDGYYICRELRRQTNLPIIIVTSRDSDVDELMSLNLGADDFITKPYNTQILLAHIASVLNRTYHNDTAQVLHCQNLSLDLSKSLALCGKQSAPLTKNELRILHTLMQNPDVIVSRDDLMEALWQSNEFIDDNTLTVNINRLRKKLEEIGAHHLIQTKRGQGYYIESGETI